jgi:hypothetical protein
VIDKTVILQLVQPVAKPEMAEGGGQPRERDREKREKRERERERERES